MVFNLENDLTPILNDKVTLIEYLRSKGILKSIVYCSECKNLLKKVKYKKNKDGEALRCYLKNCSMFLKYISIRKNSFFDGFNTELRKLILCCYKWFFNVEQIEVQRDLNLSKITVQRIYKRLRKKTISFFTENPFNLGDEGVVCQIDESMFKYKQKYHVGRISSENRWVFGIADTSSTPARYYVELVENRKAITLLPIILNICRSGSIIWSDEWSSYNSIYTLGYSHGKVNHNLHFIHPVTGVHTQNVESLWNKLKRRIKKLMGSSGNDLNEYLKEWMWKDNFGKKDFENVINLIK